MSIDKLDGIAELQLMMLRLHIRRQLLPTPLRLTWIAAGEQVAGERECNPRKPKEEAYWHYGPSEHCVFAVCSECAPSHANEDAKLDERS